MKSLKDFLNESENSNVILKNIDKMTDKDYKEFLNDIQEVGKLSEKEILTKLTNILKSVSPKAANELISISKEISDTAEKSIKENFIQESAVKKSIKELIGELFPSLSFYPALGIWGMVDQMIQSGQGFDALSPEQMKLLPVYFALFFGLVGGKIAWNRLKDRIKANKTEKPTVNNPQLALA